MSDERQEFPTLRVLQVISNFGVGGAEVWLIALLRCFKEQCQDLGAHVQTDVFLTNGVRDQLDEEAASLGARLIYAKYSRYTLPSFVSEWRRTLSTGNYAAVHDHQEFTAGWHFLFGGRYLPRVRIAHLHNPIIHQTAYRQRFLRSSIIRVGNRLIARNATHLLSTSRRLITEQGYDDLASASHLPKLAVHCGFDPTRFAGSRSIARRSILAELDLPPDAKIMLFVGRLDSHASDALNQKNPTFCIEVARYCAEQHPDFICLVAGGGTATRHALEERVAQWDLASRIRFLGPRSDVPQLMLASDVLLFPSMSEGLGMVAVEAQAAGLHVIASDAVPRECVVVQDMVDFLPLSLGSDRWAKIVLDRISRPKVDHRTANLQVVDSPFSITNSAKALIRIYSGTAARETAGKSISHAVAI